MKKWNTFYDNGSGWYEFIEEVEAPTEFEALGKVGGLWTAWGTIQIARPLDVDPNQRPEPTRK